MIESASAPTAYRTFVSRLCARIVRRNAKALLAAFAGLLFLTSSLAQKVEPKVAPSELTVFAAADMQPVLEVLGPYFERRMSFYEVGHPQNLL